MGNGGAAQPTQLAEAQQSEAPRTALQIFTEVYNAHQKATANEAGRPEGRIFPELDCGAQRYPDPRIWGPENGGIPLTLDPDYKKVLRLIYDLGIPEGLDRPRS
jgi:hypothetical protein